MHTNHNHQPVGRHHTENRLWGFVHELDAKLENTERHIKRSKHAVPGHDATLLDTVQVLRRDLRELRSKIATGAGTGGRVDLDKLAATLTHRVDRLEEIADATAAADRLATRHGRSSDGSTRIMSVTEELLAGLRSGESAAIIASRLGTLRAAIASLAATPLAD